MEVGTDGKSECPKCHGQCYVQGGTNDGGAELKAFIADVSDVGNSADRPSGKTPHLYMPSRDGEGDAHDSVGNADN